MPRMRFDVEQIDEPTETLAGLLKALCDQDAASLEDCAEELVDLAHNDRWPNVPQAIEYFPDIDNEE